MLRLRSLREEAGKTQAQLAAIFKISRQVYANYENEINQPSLHMLIAMANYFQCSLDYLLGRSDDFGNVTVVPEYSEKENFSAEERTLLKDFRTLNSHKKQILLDFACFLKEKRQK